MIELEVYAAGVRNPEKMMALALELDVIVRPSLQGGHQSRHYIYGVHRKCSNAFHPEVRLYQNWLRSKIRWSVAARDQFEEEYAAD